MEAPLTDEVGSVEAGEAAARPAPAEEEESAGGFFFFRLMVS